MSWFSDFFGGGSSSSNSGGGGGASQGVLDALNKVNEPDFVGSGSDSRGDYNPNTGSPTNYDSSGNIGGSVTSGGGDTPSGGISIGGGGYVPPEVPVLDPIQDALDDLGLPDYGDDQQALDDITDTITDMNNGGDDNTVTPAPTPEPAPTPSLPTIDLDKSYLLDSDGNFVLTDDGTDYVTTPNQPTLREQLGDTSDIFEYRETTADDVAAINASIQFNSELKSLQERNQSLQSEYDYYKEAYGESSIFAEELKKQLDENSSLLSQYEQDLNASTEQYANLSGMFDQLSTDYSALVDTTIPELQSNLSSANQAITGLEADLVTAQNDLAAMEAQYGSASAQAEAARQQVTSLESNLSSLSSERDQLQQDLASLPANIVKQEAKDRGFVDPTNALIAQYENPLDYLTDAEALSKAEFAEGSEIDLTNQNLYSQASKFRETLGEDASLYVDSDNKVYGKNNASLLGATEMFGTQLGNSVLGFFGGLLGGNIAYALTGSNATALQTAQLSNQALKGFQPLQSDVFVDLEGNEYVKASVFGNETFLTREEVEANAAKAREEANQWAENSDQDDIANSMSAGMSIGSGGRGTSWKDYYKAGDAVDLEKIAFDTIRGVVDASDIKSVEFGTRIALGDDVVSTAFDVYGDAVRDILPEGYEQPTEAAIRIGLGENRVEVLGEIYGDDIGIDTPMEKAALEGATVYDKTQDGDEALGKAIYTYFKEGGTITDFEIPSFIPNDVDFNINLDRLKGFGLPFSGAVDFLGSVDWPDIVDIDIPLSDFLPKLDKINLEGVSFNDLKTKFPDIKLEDIKGKLPEVDLDIDLSGIQAGLDYYSQSGVIPESEQFQSLESDFELTQDDESLARKLISTAV
jgi:regulator of replication initiation timing